MLLAFETSGLRGSVAIARADGEIHNAVMGEPLCHARDLLTLTVALLDGASSGLEDVESVAVGVGPGSYTGMRVGIAAAKGLCWARDLPLVGVSSLRVLALNAPEDASVVVPTVDAKRGAVYCAVYVRKNETLIEEMPASLARAVDVVRGLPDGATLVGSGTPVMLEAAAERNLVAGDKALWLPCAGKLAALALQKLAIGQTTSPLDIAPCYLRRSEAEERWEEKRRRA